MREIVLVTTNKAKTEEITDLLSHYQIQVKLAAEEKLEIQSHDLKEIVRYAAADLVGKIAKPYLLEDAGLFVDALNGFPGPYSSYVFKTVGVQGILAILAGSPNRGAEFRSAVAFHSDRTGLKVFEAVARGKIASHALGTGGFGFDPIFVPDEGSGKTFAQMSVQEKNRYSHRAKAVRMFAEWSARSDNT